MGKPILIFATLLVITSLVFGGCTGTTSPATTTSQAISSPPSTTQTQTPTTTTPSPTVTPTQTPPPTTPTLTELINWLDVTQYTGIPSSDCREPITDLTGLSTAQFKLAVDMAQQEGILDNSLWANVGLSSYNCGVTDDNVPLWEMNRQTGVFKYVRIFGPFNDGIPKNFIEPVKQFLNGQRSLELGASNFLYEGWRVYTEDENGNPVYNFWYLDCVIDSFISAGVKPIVSVSFMPDALAEGEKFREFDGGLVNTPRDYDKWRDLVYHTVEHCIARYGVSEVRTWYWEIWNEPDIEAYFIDATSGNTERFLKMYDFFAAGAKAADSQIKVG